MERPSHAQAQAQAPAQPREPAPSVDAGWDDERAAPVADIPSFTTRPGSDIETGEWGHDSDEPAAVVKLVPDLPADDVDADGEYVDVLDARPEAGVVTNVGGVKFYSAGRIYEVDAGDASYAVGEQVMIEAGNELQLAIVAVPPRRRVVPPGLSRIVRRVEQADREQALVRDREAVEMLHFAKDRVRAHRVGVKMFKVDLLPGSQKAVFYFASEDRIDIRAVVRDLVQKFRVRVEMRQTGVRDEAKLVGGIGDCGRELCCTTWLPKFEPISIKMAKNQQLNLNPTKVTGQCGRLKCCLVYEDAQYREMGKGLPKMGKRVETPAGVGRVVEVDILRQRIRVAFETGDYEVFPAGSVRPAARPQMGGGAGAAPPEPEPETEEA